MALTKEKKPAFKKEQNRYQPRLKAAYFQTIQPQLLKELGLDNLHQVPQLKKIVINAGLGRQKDDKRAVAAAENSLIKISGQKPLVTKARISVASFKLRAGQNIGLKVTLRGDQMYEFLDRLVSLVIPRFRNFRGLNRRSFDSSGNYSLGIIDQSVFPELTFEETNPSHGLQVTLALTSPSSEASRVLLESFGFKFTKEN